MDALIKPLRAGKAADDKSPTLGPTEAKATDLRAPEVRPTQLDPSDYLEAAVRPDQPRPSRDEATFGCTE